MADAHRIMGARWDVEQQMNADESDPKTRDLEIQALRAMTPEQKVDLMVQLTIKERQAIRSDIRMRHPEYSYDQVDRELMVRLYGEELMDKAWPRQANDA